MISPDVEGLAYQRNIRTGIMSLPEAIRERGYDPDVLFEEIAASNKRLDALGLVLDSDARRMTQAGQFQTAPEGAASGASRALDRFAALLRDLPDARATEILAAMFGESNGNGHDSIERP